VSGFRHFPVGVDMAVERATFPLVGTLSRAEIDAFVRAEMFPGFTSARALPDLLDLAGIWAPDLVVWDNCLFAGAVAAESWGIPHASVKTVDWYRSYPDRFALAPRLETLRAFVRLPPDPECAMQFRYLHLIVDPPQFQREGELLPPTARRLRRAIFDRSGEEGLPAWVADLARQPTIYATLGTVFNRPAVFSAIIEALRDEPHHLILTVGRDVDPGQFGPQPENIHIERYIPQSLLLGHCDVVLSHGGSGTIMAALAAGLPLVNIPLAIDQAENAARCVEIGVGLSIAPEERTPAQIRAAVREVLTERSYRAAAERVRDEIAALPGPEYAVALLERLAVEKQPLTRETERD
jgi:UDP:flavonoid glycosyltransferase YjiC (YdhE family)